MSIAIVVRDARGERSYREADLPLLLGGSGTADVELPGSDGAAALARIGIKQDNPFLEPITAGTATMNGQPLSGPVWLHDGDLLSAGTSRIQFELDSMRLVVLLGGAAGAATVPPETRPADEGGKVADASPGGMRPAAQPEIAPDGGGADAGVIAPADFRRPDLKIAGKRRRLRLLPILLSIGFAFLALVVWYMFTARAVQFHIEPVPDEILIEDALVALELGGRYLLRPGSYTLVARKEGFRESREAIEVGRAASQEFAFSMEKLPGFLDIGARPVAQAQVLVDGEVRGNTPLPGVELRPGQHRVLVRAERYLDYETDIEIEGGGLRQTLEATLEPNWAPVALTSKPPGAELSVDGNALGLTTPLVVDLDSGSRELSLRANGFKTWQGRIVVTAGEPLSVPEVVLEKSDGLVSIRSEPSGASVTVNGDYRGQTPLKLGLAPGRSYTVSLTRAGFQAASRSISVRTGEDASLNVTLEPAVGNVSVLTTPRDTEIFVDGVAHGRAGNTLVLSAVPHKIEARKQGYATASQSVTPRPGFDQEISLTLMTEAQARSASRPERIKTKLGQELRLVLPGKFQAGASRREPGRRANEVIYPVELTRPFYIGLHEVSNAQFRAWRANHSSGKKNQYDLNGDRQPVVRITWDDAARYCNWLSARESLPLEYVEKKGRMGPADSPGRGYRLPTEAEWAWTARFAGGTASRVKFPWGDSLPPPPRAGNFADDSARQLAAIRIDQYDDGHAVSAPVGSFDPNPLGIFDLGGNVAEWVHDYYAIPVGDGSATLTDPMGPAVGEFHVIRGAGYMHGGIGELRLTYRDYGATEREDVGFRLARYAD